MKRFLSLSLIFVMAGQGTALANQNSNDKKEKVKDIELVEEVDESQVFDNEELDKVYQEITNDLMPAYQEVNNDLVTIEKEQDMLFKTFTREKGKPKKEVEAFEAKPGKYKILIINDIANKKGVSSAKITLNGESLLTPDELNSNQKIIEKEVELKDLNTLEVIITGEPNSFIAVGILNVDETDETEDIFMEVDNELITFNQ